MHMEYSHFPRRPRYPRREVGIRKIGARLAATSVIVLLLGLLVSLSGCETLKFWGKDSKKRALPPAPLVKFEPREQLQRLWRQKVGAASDDPYVKLIPVVRKERLFAATLEGGIHAYDARTGAPLWETDIELPIRGGPGLGDTTVLVGTNNGDVVALSQDNGKLLWKAKVSSEVLSVPRGSQGVVVARTIDGKLFGLDGNDGSRRWLYERSVPVLTLRGTSAPVFGGDFVISGFDGGQLAAVSIKDGFTIWETRVALPRGRFDIERMVDIDGEITIMGNAVYAVTFQGQIAAIDLASGKIFWKRDMSSYVGLGVHGENLYVTDEQSHLWALDRRSGESRWHRTEFERRKLTAPVGFSLANSRNYVAVGDFEGYLHILDGDNGDTVARVHVDGKGIVNPPIIVEDANTLYVYGRGGTLAAFRVGN
uniref:Outer membrane protein assembly factor BamB n=1 Tax=Candidatus Kentrum sp. SD TaxID=2126332 RepID=A0A450YW83_9GAMM|nr:MAG: Beta-barrel assembly machine subunit BamB [Candidatus Kentron sp. SD]VFK45800.1 MAG: Beta-barrel assembly machine subunit BamB [Candidatus Kentron sp. SD]